ncbi:hypothetical protein NDK25_23980 [Niallia taxi]|nr:HD domain-containing phosphohydrolase [Niallia taxi]MDE5055279.1 hypothetical protein [Niallia taxi]
MLLETEDFPKSLATNILFHHENTDKSGYYSLEDMAIPQLAKIIRIIDSYDTMLNGRIYQDSMEPDRVIIELNNLKGTLYDPYLVDYFTSFITACK